MDDLDEDLPVDLDDQFFLPNSRVTVENFAELRGSINRAYLNWLRNEIETNQHN